MCVCTYIHIRIVFSLKKERNLAIFNEMGGPEDYNSIASDTAECYGKQVSK